jgi:prepilin-type N-terminal cleavage/methylation domain-containing protein
LSKFSNLLIFNLRNKMKNSTSKKAFSLIELSIVILIIGLIIAGVLGGKKLSSLSNLSKARALTNSSPVNGIEGLIIWLETTSKNSFSTIPTDKSKIPQWNDINSQSTAKYNFAQLVTPGYQPAYNESSINGLPTVKFDRATTNHLTVSADSNSLNLTNQVTIFMVGRLNSIPAASQALLTFNQTASNRMLIIFNSSASAPRFDFPHGTTGQLVSTSSVGTDNFILSFVANSVTQAIYLNGSSVGSQSNNLQLSPFSTSIYLGSYEGGTLPADADIGEVIIFNTGLSTFERQEIEKYLSKKWGIKLT